MVGAKQMSWKITTKEHEKFERNTLSSVVAQLRFHPIVKISEKVGVSDFQDRIRSVFPQFKEMKNNSVSVDSNGGVEYSSRPVFAFTTPDSSTTLGLGEQDLTLKCIKHIGHEEFLKNWTSACKSLVEVYGPVSTWRLGLRYVNTIDAQTISSDLDQAKVEYSDLIDEKYLKLPPNLENSDKTRFVCEFRSDVGDGSMVLRYGLVNRSPTSEEAVFKFDVDRFYEGPVPVSESHESLKVFSDDIYSMFSSAIGPSLREWMSYKEDCGGPRE